MGSEESKVQQGETQVDNGISKLDRTLLNLKKVNSLINGEVAQQQSIIKKQKLQLRELVRNNQTDDAKVQIVSVKLQEKVLVSLNNIQFSVQKQIVQVESYMRTQQTLEVLNDLYKELESYNYDQMVLDVQEIKQSTELNQLAFENIDEIVQQNFPEIDLQYEFEQEVITAQQGEKNHIEANNKIVEVM